MRDISKDEIKLEKIMNEYYNCKNTTKRKKLHKKKERYIKNIFYNFINGRYEELS